MDAELSRLRRALADFGPSRPGRRVPQALRERLVADARRRRDAGESLHELGRAHGLQAETLRRWLDAGVAAPRPLPVSLVAAPSQGAHALSLVTPSGFRLEGLTAETAAELLGRLRLLRSAPRSRVTPFRLH